ncbi:hypothetical protein TCAL_17089 [Tigriopus californicus]|uniref:Uncharacterized protein n=1 Tax=Tigriopus californicus TaxID=6832 RepID=A0A553PP93_TIGCA|nr:hypothetical protein TCAL_17089 [Tigriopus californicus]
MEIRTSGTQSAIVSSCQLRSGHLICSLNSVYEEVEANAVQIPFVSPTASTHKPSHARDGTSTTPGLERTHTYEQYTQGSVGIKCKGQIQKLEVKVMMAGTSKDKDHPSDDSHAHYGNAICTNK